tara:strand:- start:237 stop:1232 length:996 start_codon:yes stop_codon:yes gene_type:complete
MDQFNLREYLKHNPLLKEEESDEEIKIYLSKEYPGAHSEVEVEEIINLYRTKYIDFKDPYGNLDGVAEAAFRWNKKNGRDIVTGLIPGSSKSTTSTINFPELEDEYEGAMDAMVVEPEIYLQDIIDDPSVVLGDDYFEVYNAVEDGIYSEEEAVELAKKWATDKLSSLSENKTLNEETLVDILMDKVEGMSSSEFEALASKAGDLEIWKSWGDIDGINNVDDRLETISQGFNNDDAKRYLDIISNLSENKTLKEEVMVDVSLMMGADADKIPAKGKIPFSKFLPLFDKYWRSTGAEGGDSDFIAQGLENHVDVGLLTYEDVDNAMDMFFES